MEILLRNAQRKIPVDTRGLKRRAAAILQTLGHERAELSVLLTNDAKIRELNYNYRNQDRPTDVLSFPQDNAAVNESGLRVLGDVVVSVETASRQAGGHRLNLDQELAFLLLHGVLHLLGHDHERSAAEARTMKRLTARVFEELFPGVKPAGTCNL